MNHPRLLVVCAVLLGVFGQLASPLECRLDGVVE
jgi:hypothetical protein